MPKILIADDNEQVRKLLFNALSKEAHWSVCGQASNGRQAVLMAHEHKPDVIILDISMPLLDGLSATAEILENTPPFRSFCTHSTRTIRFSKKQ